MPVPVIANPWTALAEAANFLPHHHANLLHNNHENTPLEPVLQALETVQAQADQPDTPAGNTTMFRAYFDDNALHTIYFLTVHGTQVVAATGLFPCNTLPSPGVRAYWLSGDYVRHATGLTAPPKIHRVAGAIDLQNAAFRRTAIAAPTLEDIQTAYAGDANLTWVPQLPADPANPPAEVEVPKALPIHPKLAPYFLRGVPIRDAVALVNQIIQIVPANMRQRTTLLSDWIRAACTSTAGVQARSWLHIEQQRVDTNNTDAQEAWHHEVAGRWAPTNLLAPNAGPNPPNAGHPNAGHPNAGQNNPNAGQNNPNAGQTNPNAGQTNPNSGQNQSGINALVQMLQNFPGNNDDDADDDSSSLSSSTRYADYEMHRIFLAAGMPRPFLNLTVEQLPDFFKVFKSLRSKSKATRARLAIERFILDNWPANMMQYEFLVSSQNIADLKDLDFTGNDPGCSYDKRGKGITMFAISPLTNAAQGESTRSQMLQYEATVDNHGPRERAAHDALSNSASHTVGIPSNRFEAIAAISFFEIWLLVIFGDRMPLLSSLSAMRLSLNNPSGTANFTKYEWNAWFWRLHQGIRYFFVKGEPTQFNTAAERFLAGDISTSGLPQELRPGHIPAQVTPAGSRTDDMSSITGGSGVGGGGGTPPNKRRRTDDQPPPGPRAAPCAAQFKADLARAEAARGERGFKAGDLARGRDAIHALFGSEFCALFPARTSPCLRYWVMGSCFGNCYMRHELPNNRQPSGGIVQGIKSRVKARCDAIVANPNA